MSLTRDDVKQLLQEHQASVDKEECWTCDCFLGFLTQLEIDAEEDVSDLLDPLKKPREKVHGCLGCKPCSPGASYARYLKSKC